MNKYSWLLTLAPLVAMACSNNNGSGCGGFHPPCTSPGNFIEIVSNRALVKNLTWGGPACEGAHIVYIFGSNGPVDSNNAFVPDELDYEIGPSTSGTCDVHVELESGDILEQSFAFTYQGGCCPSYNATGNPWYLNDPNVDAG